MSTAPNVLIFIPHDLGNYLHCYGHEDVCSPNLDRLADSGVRFTNYFTTSPECTSSRATMMTGLHTHQNGLVGLSGMGWELNDFSVHLASRMKRAGYATNLFGVQHETALSAKKLGYDSIQAAADRSAPAVAHELVEFLKTAKSGQPWFVSAGFTHVHRPWPKSTTFKQENVQLPKWLPDTPEVRQDYTLFYQNILEMDTAVGSVIDELEHQGMRENTLIIFTTDHGYPFPRAKATFYDAGLNIPLLISQPGQIRSGQVRNNLLSNLDFTPTVLDYCGIRPDRDIEGTSFAGLLVEDKTFNERKEIFGGMCYDVSYDPIYYVRTRRYKYIRSFAANPQDSADADRKTLATFSAGKWIRFDDYDVMSSPAWISIADIVDRSRPAPEELYDLEVDPGEENNLISIPEYSEVAGELRNSLFNMLSKTDCPLPEKHIPPTPEQVKAATSYGQKLGIR